MNKKSQVQMIETISVLFVFFILIAIGFVFFAKVQGWGTKEQMEETVQKKAINIAQIASFLPELQCSEENVIADNCVDIEKVKIIKAVFDSNEGYYFDIFGYTTIEVGYIYSSESTLPDFDNGVLYNKELPSSRNQIITSVPILLKNPINKRYDFGLMNITTYSK